MGTMITSSNQAHSHQQAHSIDIAKGYGKSNNHISISHSQCQARLKKRRKAISNSLFPPRVYAMIQARSNIIFLPTRRPVQFGRSRGGRWSDTEYCCNAGHGWRMPAWISARGMKNLVLSQIRVLGVRLLCQSLALTLSVNLSMHGSPRSALITDEPPRDSHSPFRASQSAQSEQA